MAKDYVKTKPRAAKQPMRRNPKSANTEGKLWMFAFALIGLFILGLLYLKQEGIKMGHSTALSKPTLDDVAEQPSKKPKTEKQMVQPRFDFYTMLPNGQVATAAPTETKVQSQPKVAKTEDSPQDKATNTNTARDEIASLAKQDLARESQEEVVTNTAPVLRYYILQLGVFKDSSAADQFKAQLVMQGVEAKVRGIKRAGGTQYQVWIGPYKSQVQATKIQQKLKNEQINTVLVKSNK